MGVRALSVGIRVLGSVGRRVDGLTLRVSDPGVRVQRLSGRSCTSFYTWPGGLKTYVAVLRGMPRIATLSEAFKRLQMTAHEPPCRVYGEHGRTKRFPFLLPRVQRHLYTVL